MQQLNPSEISDIIKSRIEGLDVKSEAQNEGTIVGVSDGILEYEMTIWNRWGELVFQSNDFQIGWDGTKDGLPVQDGAYVYHIKIKDYFLETYDLTGLVVNIR